MNKQDEKIDNKLSELSKLQGITTEEAGLRANEFGVVINQYYKEHPEEYQLLLKRIPSLENSTRDLVESFNPIIDFFLNAINVYIEIMNKMIKSLLNDKKNKEKNNRLHMLKRKQQKHLK